MRRTLSLLLTLSTACASTPTPHATEQAMPQPAAAPAPMTTRDVTTREITFTATARNAAGRDDFEYRYTLAREGSLRFGAYYFNFPIHMNHNDNAEWNAGAHAARVFAASDALLADPERMAELCEVPDEGEVVADPCGEPAPAGAPVYTLSLHGEGGSSTWRAMQPESAAFQTLDAAFRAMTSAFEVEMQRPIPRGALPQ